MAKPKFIERIIEAIAQLGEKNGSSAKNILNYVRKTNPTLSRNLTLQVQRSLKTAVLGGLVKLCGSRYKILKRSGGDGGERPVERKPRHKAAVAAAAAPVSGSKKPRGRRQRSVKRHPVSSPSSATGDKQQPRMPPPRQATSSSRPRLVERKISGGKTSSSSSRSKPSATSSRKPIAKPSAKAGPKKSKKNPRDR